MSDGRVSAADAVFAELYRSYYRPVRHFCRRRLADDLVEDAVAETFLTAWRRLDEVPTGDHALVWIYGVAILPRGQSVAQRITPAAARDPVALDRAAGRGRRRRVGARRGGVPPRPGRGGRRRVTPTPSCPPPLRMGTAGHRRHRRRTQHRPQRGEATPPPAPAQPRPRVPPAPTQSTFDPRCCQRRCPVITDDEVLRLFEAGPTPPRPTTPHPPSMPPATSTPCARGAAP